MPSAPRTAPRPARTASAEVAPVACAGPLLVAELDALERALLKPGAAAGRDRRRLQGLDQAHGARSLLNKVDKLIVGGGIANTFLAATGVQVGKSLCEMDMLDMARACWSRRGARRRDSAADRCGGGARVRRHGARRRARPSAKCRTDEMILDIGPDTAERLCAVIKGAGTVCGTVPVGVFEFDQFGEGTKAIANAIASSAAYSLAGGGDTLAAIEKYGVEDGISYISTGGGAFLEFVEGKTLPAVAMLQARAAG
jgi:phosphoglycerate kinase